MFDRIFLDEIRVRGGGQNCLYASMISNRTKTRMIWWMVKVWSPPAALNLRKLGWQQPRLRLRHTGHHTWHVSGHHVSPRLATVSPLLSLLPRAGTRVLCCERGEARGTTEQCRAPAAAHRHRHRRGQRRQFTRAFVNTSSCGPVAVWAHCSID